MNTKVWDEHCLRCTLSKGNEHRTFLTEPSFDNFSLKENMRTEAVMTDFANEFRMMGKFDHKNIVRLRGICLPSGRLVMEYIESGSLFNWLTRNNKDVSEQKYK